MKNSIPTLEDFLAMPVEEVAKLVRASGSKVVVFPINGTRRWFALEYGDQEFEDPFAAYLDIAIKKNIELYKQFFDHGVDTLLAPVIGPEILATRDAYMQKIGAEGLARPVNHQEFLDFYEYYDVRVRFYGEYHKYLINTPYESLISQFDDISRKTEHHKRSRLFFGAFADQLQNAETVAQLSVKHYLETGKIPDRKKIVELYYGDYIEKANIFIGFDRLAVFDYPLLSWGEEDLYFTIAPSPYISEKQLRYILYDHIYTRRVKEPDHFMLAEETLAWLRNFYKTNDELVLGVGMLHSGIWIPKLK